MNNLRTRIKVTMALGFLSLFMGLIGHLALTDIYHSEGDVSLEWNILRVCALVLVIFIGYTLLTLRKILKTI